jgi:hypothetical protein
MWDVFISHASEDKADVVLPLARELERAGLRVWLDVHELGIGESLLTEIDEGLANSGFGVVVLSPAFFAKSWTRSELNGLFAMEQSHGKRILPVWHRVQKPDVAKFSPILADRMAGSTENGIAALAQELVRAVLASGVDTPAVSAPTRVLLLQRLLADDPAPEALRGFFARQPEIIAAGLHIWGYPVVRESITMGPFTFDLAARTVPQGTSGETDWYLLSFLSPRARITDDGGQMTAEIHREHTRAGEFRSWLTANEAAARESLQSPDTSEPPSVNLIAVAGRRASLTDLDRNLVRELGDHPIKLRTYDWLVDAAVSVEQRIRGDFY